MNINIYKVIMAFEKYEEKVYRNRNLTPLQSILKDEDSLPFYPYYGWL